MNRSASSHRSKRQQRRRRGMTLLEIMVVITLLGIIAAAVGVSAVGMLNQGKIDSARTESYNLESAVKTFYTIVGRYPTNAEGLDVLLNPPKGKPTLERLGKDPWGNPYQYLYPGTNNPNSVDIKSLGPDGQEGGGDDIGNWDTEAQ